MFFTIIAGDLDCPKLGGLAYGVYQMASEKFKMPNSNACEILEIKSPHWTLNMNNEYPVFVKKPESDLETSFRDLMARGGFIDCRLMRGIAMHISALLYSSDMKKQIKEPIVLTNYCSVYETVALLSFDFAPVGSFLYIPNIPEYKKVHPLGGCRGQHLCVICKNENGEKLFVGFSRSEPQTYTEVCVEMYRALLAEIDMHQMMTKAMLTKAKEELESGKIVTIPELFGCLSSGESSLDYDRIAEELEEKKRIQDKYRKNPALFYEELFKTGKTSLKADVLKKEYRDSGVEKV